MTNTHTAGLRTDTITLIRNEPVQARSTARLAALLDAAAAVVDDIGYERLTTAMVAEHAGASIGTVYRYFPDRIAVLQSLAARNIERFSAPAVAAIADSRHTDWVSAVSAAVDVLVDAFRNEPGFASIRFGDVLDLRPAAGAPANTVFADHLFEALIARFDLSGSDDARVAFEASIESIDALVTRAFARDPKGDKRFLAHALTATTALLGEYFPRPAR